MQYTYEFEMWRGEFAWIAAPFDLVGITQGVDVEDVCESAADLLRELAREYLMRGETPPKATFDHEPSHGGVRLHRVRRCHTGRHRESERCSGGGTTRRQPQPRDGYAAFGPSRRLERRPQHLGDQSQHRRAPCLPRPSGKAKGRKARMTTNDIERYVQKRSKRDPEFIQAWENSHSKHEALRQKSNSNNLNNTSIYLKEETSSHPTTTSCPSTIPWLVMLNLHYEDAG